MPRTLSAQAKAAIFAQETGEAVILLLTIEHADLAEPIRVSSDAVDTVSDSITYQAFPFQITFPRDSDDAPPQVRLTIDNVDRRIVQAVRELMTPPTVNLQLVLASQPDVVEVVPGEFTLASVTFDALAVEGVLKFDDILNEPFPKDVVTPATFPGLF